MLVQFEIDVILDEYQTTDKMDEISEEFEIDVILDEYQMFQLFNINKYLFEIDIIRKISKVQSILYHIECFL